MLSLGSSFKHYRIVTYALSVMLISLCLDNVIHFGMELHKWDILLISGVAIFIPGVNLAFTIPVKLEQTLIRLVNRGTLETTQERLLGFEKDLKNTTEKWAIRTAILIAITMLLVFFIAFGFPIPVHKIFITVLETIGGFIAGAFLGSMLSYGRLGWLLKQKGLGLKILPGHIDGVGGLKPVGDFYFRQAMVAAIPAIFLAVWLLIFQIGNVGYQHWRIPYAWLLGVALLFEILIFWVPLLSFRREMVVQKRAYLQVADKLSQEIMVVQNKLNAEQDAQMRELLKDQLSTMTKQYWDIENLSTWPVAVQTKRLFRRSNIALVLPLLIELIGNTWVGKSQLWPKAVEVINRAVG